MSESLATHLMRLMPRHVNPEDYNDSFFYIGLTPEAADPWLTKSSQWKYEYEKRERTLEHAFGIDPCIYLKGKRVLDFGCFTGGAGLAWMEMYGADELCGFDVDQIYIRGAEMFAEKKGARATFRAGFGEEVPFDGPFDAVVSLDVFEHVRDLEKCLSECWRVLAPGGHLLASFPPFWNPRAHHLKVSATPALHWLFSGETLMHAQNALYRKLGVPKYASESLDGYRIPCLNGVTVHSFFDVVRRQGWKVVRDHRLGFPSAGRLARRNLLLRAMSKVTTPLAAVPLLDEIFLDHVSVILQRPNSAG